MEIISNSQIPDLFFNRCWFVDQVGRYSADFIALAKNQEKLTFNKKYLDLSFKDWNETPFEEINYGEPLLLDSVRDYSSLPKFEGDYETYLNLIIERLKSVLLMLDPCEKYIFSHSSGADSRIISGVMTILREESRANFDNVLFHCWGQPEEKSFRGIMEKCGWSNISMHDDTRPNVYDVGIDSYSVDGWNPYASQMKFWGDIDPSEYIFFSGGEAGAFQLPYSEWVHSRAFFVERGEAIHRLAKIFKGIFFPFLSRPVLDLLLAMPDEWRNIKDPRIGRDKIRGDLVEKVGLLDFPVEKARYNFNFTEDRKKQMINLYEKSKFKKDCNVELNYENLFSKHNSWDSRAWAFAVTVYEKLM